MKKMEYSSYKSKDAMKISLIINERLTHSKLQHWDYGSKSTRAYREELN